MLWRFIGKLSNTCMLRLSVMSWHCIGHNYSRHVAILSLFLSTFSSEDLYKALKVRATNNLSFKILPTSFMPSWLWWLYFPLFWALWNSVPSLTWVPLVKLLVLLSHFLGACEQAVNCSFAQCGTRFLVVPCGVRHPSDLPGGAGQSPR